MNLYKIKVQKQHILEILLSLINFNGKNCNSKKNKKAFNKVISVDGDKSLSIRSLLIGSQSYGLCKIKNLPKSEDVLSTIYGLRKLGIKIFLKTKSVTFMEMA